MQKGVYQQSRDHRYGNRKDKAKARIKFVLKEWGPEKMRETILEERKIAIKLDAKAKAWLAETGYDPVYGARPLRRVIQRALQDPLARMILEGEISDGEVVKVSAGKRGLIINGVEVETLGEPLGLIGGSEPPSHAVH